MVFNEEVVVIDSPPSPCPHQPKSQSKSQSQQQQQQHQHQLQLQQQPSTTTDIITSSACQLISATSPLSATSTAALRTNPPSRPRTVASSQTRCALNSTGSSTSSSASPLHTPTSGTLDASSQQQEQQQRQRQKQQLQRQQQQQQQQQQQHVVNKRTFVDVVRRLCGQLGTRMSQKTSSQQQQQQQQQQQPPPQPSLNRIKDLKQVAPLQVPKEETDATEPIQLGDGLLLRKTSNNGKVTVYMPKIEFEDLGCLTEPVEGIVTYDPSKLEPGEKVYIALVGRFRYGREEDEILGMSLCREIYMGYAPVCSMKKTLTLQSSNGSFSGSPPGDPIAGPSSGTARLEHQRSLGGGRATEPISSSSSTSTSVDLRSRRSIPLSPFHEATLPYLPPESVPFRFEFPCDAPVSMVMQRLTPDAGDTCGVRYYVRCYSSLDIDDQQTTISLLNFPIKKVQYMSLARNLLNPSANETPPKGTILKEFPLNGGSLSLEATLNKAVYEHGEEIRVKIHLSNSSHKTIKHVKVSVLQVADICLFSTGKWKVCVATTNNRNDCPISTGNSIEQEVVLIPKVGDNKHKYGVFVQSRTGPEPDCLASSTIVSDDQRKNLFGIVVDYEVKVKLCLGTLSSLSGRGEIACFIPFQIHHSGPADVTLPGQHGTIALPSTTASTNQQRPSSTGHGSLSSNGNLRIVSASVVEQMEQLQVDDNEGTNRRSADFPVAAAAASTADSRCSTGARLAAAGATPAAASASGCGPDGTSGGGGNQPPAQPQ